MNIHNEKYSTKIQNIMPKGVRFLFDLFTHYNYEIYLVGGCVRDIILNREPHDWDMCTSARPNQMLELVKIVNQQPNTQHIEAIPTGIEHGTITFIVNDEQIEITTYRCDGIYSDNRRPDNVVFVSNLVDDLRRRDFTMNAIAYNPYQGYIDPFNGISDIKNGIIKCVGFPKERFSEDALRILRCVRFASQLNFTIEPYTLHMAETLANNLQYISSERIMSELCKGLQGQNVEHMLNWRILSWMIPEIIAMVGFEQHNPYHIYNAYEHTINALKNEQTGNLIIRLALLFHDIGKPYCVQIDTANGIYHFRGHGELGANITKEIMKSLRFDNDTINKVVQLVFYHDATIESEKKHIKRWLNRIGEEQFRNLLIVRQCDIKAQNPQYEEERLKKIDTIFQRLEEVLEDKDCFQIKDLAISGRDLIKVGIPEGKLIGKILNYLLHVVINGDVPNERDKLFEIVNLYFASNPQLYQHTNQKRKGDK